MSTFLKWSWTINKSRSERKPRCCFSKGILRKKYNALAVKKVHGIKNAISLILHGSINQLLTICATLGNIITPGIVNDATNETE